MQKITEVTFTSPARVAAHGLGGVLVHVDKVVVVLKHVVTKRQGFKKKAL